MATDSMTATRAAARAGGAAVPGWAGAREAAWPDRFSGQPSSVEPLPLRLHRAVALLSRLDHPGAAEAQDALSEVAARIVVLGAVLRAVLDGRPGAAETARRVLSGE